jgi:hypothetical protein
MRRFFFIAAASVLLVALVPASAFARRHHHRSHHHARVHHSRTHVRRFGDVTGAPTTTTSSDNAGTVLSFDGTTLVIQLNNPASSTVSGTVTPNTEFDCQAAGTTSTTHPDGDHGGGDNANGGGDDNTAAGNDDNTAAGNDDNTNGGDENNANGDDDNANGGDENNGASCSTANLKPGAVVREADLRISSSGQEWKKLELIS